jgi:hypothetical protein
VGLGLTIISLLIWPSYLRGVVNMRTAKSDIRD